MKGFSHFLQQGGGKRGEADGYVNSPARRDPSGGPKNQGNVDELAVESIAVGHQAMLAEALAMVGGDDYQGVASQAAPLQLSHELLDLVVHVIDGAVVGVHRALALLRGQVLKPVPVFGSAAARVFHRGIAMQIRLGRAVGVVHVKIVQKNEEGPVTAVNPAQGMTVDLLGAAPTEEVLLQLQLKEQVLDEVAVKGLREAAGERLKVIFEMNKAAAKTAAQLKKLELARALATRPKLLLADESLGGLDHAEMDRAADMLGRIRRDLGITIVWVEHIMGVLMRVVDRVIVLDHGELIFEGLPRDAVKDSRVAEVYLGRSH